MFQMGEMIVVSHIPDSRRVIQCQMAHFRITFDEVVLFEVQIDALESNHLDVKEWFSHEIFMVEHFTSEFNRSK